MSAQKTRSRWRLFAVSLKMLWLPALILLTCMSATGCLKRGTVRTQGVPPEVLELLNPLPAFDPNLLQPGPESLPQAKADDVPTLIRNHVDSAGIYHDVREKHVGLINQAKERQKIEAERIERVRKVIDRQR